MTPPRHHAPLPTRPTLAEASAYQASLGTYGLTSWGEYLPASATWIPEAPLFAGADEGTGLHEKLDQETLPPDALLEASGNPWRAVLELSLAQPQTLILHTYWFSGWRATIDGDDVPVEPDERGLLSIDVPAGERQVVVRWGRTPLRALADGLSVVSAVILLGAALWPDRKSAPARVPERPRPAHHDRSLVTPLLAISGVLMLLLAGKTLVLDRVDSPLLRHAGAGGLRGVAVPPWGHAENALRLVGYDMEPDGRVALYWQALAPVDVDYVTAIQVSDMRGVPLATMHNVHPGLVPTTRWEPGDLVRDVQAIELPDAELPMAYRLSAQILHPDTQEPLAWLDAPAPGVDDVPITIVRLPDPEPTIPGEARPVGVLFGDAIELEEAAVPAASMTGESVDYVLVWRAHASSVHDYTVFVHLLDAEGQLAANDDGQPLEGLYPTSVWEPGEVVVDGRTLTADLPPGEYQLVVGLYRLETGERLSATAAGGPVGDSVSLGTLIVSE